MKFMTLLGIGAFAAGTMGALPADAQRYDGGGYRGQYNGGDHYRGHGYDRGHGYRGERFHGGYGAGRSYGYRGDYGFGRGHGYGYGHGGFYGRPRVVCRLRPGYYGPVRRCFRAY